MGVAILSKKTPINNNKIIYNFTHSYVMMYKRPIPTSKPINSSEKLALTE
jgi:hypothetical protein